MKRILVLLGALLLCTFYANSAYFSFLPYEITQPDGEKISCFVSGDEFYHWMHDKDGYTIIQSPDGYYYYGVSTGDSIVPTTNKVNSSDPGILGINKWEKVSVEKYEKNKSFLQVVPKEEISGSETNTPPLSAPHTNTLNNIVIYIRFADDDEFTATRQSFDDKFNLVPGTSLQAYFKEVSYDNLTISSTHYPACDMTTNFSYQDSHPRAYFEPYNETTNPIGYTGGNNSTDRRVREHTLLKNAIEWVNANSPVPSGLNVDGDNDGYVDNVCFNIVGGNGGWAALLWAHKWALYSYAAYINGKRVWEYTFQPETQVSVKTLCHEMFHSLGAPDLYHYSYDGLSPTGNWDLMHSGFGHMGAYMKWKYANQAWISNIPEITTSGTYTLNPLASPTNNCYKVASPNSSSQFFVMEYRRRVSGTFENNVPGSGLLVYRIDPSRNGNASGPPDEVYIFRPNGTPTVNGSINSAHFSSDVGRTEINDYTNPYSFLQDGSPGGLSISNVTSAGSTISFDVNYDLVAPPDDFSATAVSHSQIDLSWLLNSESDNVLLAFNTSGIFGEPVSGSFYLPGDTIPGGDTVIYNGANNYFNHINLEPNTTYHYKIWSYNADIFYSLGTVQWAKTLCAPLTILPWNEDFNYGEVFPDCWSQEEVNDSRAWWYMTMDYDQGNPDTVTNNFYAILNDYSTSDNVSRLITPSFDLGNYANATLAFWHKQEAWNGNQDELTVKYKTSATGSWIELESYTNEYSTWTEEVIPLPEISSDFHICFEGNAKYGFGVYIDDVTLTETENTPGILALNNVSYNTGEQDCFGALQSITVAGNGNTVDFLSGSSVNLIAGESISFLPGFHAHSGSYMDAYITTTGSFCDALPEQAIVEYIAPEKLKSSTIQNLTESTDHTISQPLSVILYPNPNNGIFNVETNLEGESILIKVINNTGALVYQNRAMQLTTKLNLQTLRSGIYFLQVVSGGQQKTLKFIIE
ncbi:MAG: M6 family metalloprotease domain-containing protein [Prolixibacteraceae bacterium]|nr:M6 family metalloprotease domain-containing protein [Prolixibacteraceae bacterium]